MKAALFSLTSILVSLVTSTPVLNVDIHITDDNDISNSPTTSRHLQHVLKSASGTRSEQIPGWIFIEQKTFRARIHGNTFWNIKGTLDEPFPMDEFLFDPLLFALNAPNDFTGKFNGTCGSGQISLAWEKSGATIVGRSPVGDFALSGESEVDYSP